MTTLHTTREAWLTALARAFRPVLAGRGLKVPETFRVSCGWPSKSALSGKGGSRTIGQCFNPCCSADGVTELFISPVLADPMRVADVLAHEMIHAALPNAKHGPAFAKAALSLGLAGKPTATVAGPDFLAWATPLVETLGTYPHATLDVTRQVKPQTTRMLKVACGDCGYTVRTTRKWLDDAGAPLCPCNTRAMTEL
jgi:hypothetical protein